MIDYEKLKLAHELALKTEGYFVGFYFGNTIEKKDEFTLFNSNGVIDRNFDSIDSLIAKLQELIKPKFKLCDACQRWLDNHIYDTGFPLMYVSEIVKECKEKRHIEKQKYQLGQEVWFVDCNAVFSAVIDSIGIDEYRVDDGKNKTGKDWYHVSELYPSREALIVAQLEYWTRLKNEEKSTHSDDMSISPTFEGEIKGFN